MRNAPRHAVVLAASAALLLLFQGCYKPTAPRPQSLDANGGRGPAEPAAQIFEHRPRPIGNLRTKEDFYPLQLGNRWRYVSTATTSLRGVGDRSFMVWPDTTWIETAQACTQFLSGRFYTVELTTQTTLGGVSTYWVLYRQDHSGLYEADVVDQTPPCVEVSAMGTGHARGPAPSDRAAWDALAARISEPTRLAACRAAWEKLQARVAATHDALVGLVPGPASPAASRGLMSNEITRLRYPLAPKQRWVIRSDPLFSVSAVVEGGEALHLPAGLFPSVRIRLLSPQYGRNDVVRYWYGRDGFLKLQEHFESVTVVDEEGRPVDVWSFDVLQVLDGLWLVDRAHAKAAAVTEVGGE